MFDLIDNLKDCSPDFVEEWQQLGQEALVPNPFYDPDFLLPALTHLEKQTVKIATLRSKNNELIALAPIVEKQLLVFGTSYISFWNHPYTPLTSPLVHQAQPQAFEDLIAALLHKVQKPIIISELKGFEKNLKEAGLPFKNSLLQSHERAMLKTGLTGGDYRKKTLSKKSRQGLNRRYRRLEEKTKPLGILTIDFCDDQAFIPSRFEAFMRLEKLGWKGTGKTALLSKQKHANFARESLLSFSKRQMAAVATLQAGETVLAALTLFKVGNTYFSWKTAFDESYKNYSPGTQILARFYDPMLDDGAIALDSCAAPDNTIANRIWAERITIEKRLFYLEHQKNKACWIKYIDRWKNMLYQKAKAILKAVRSS